MKKTLSFFLAAIMLFAFSSVAFAADVNFSLTAFVDDNLEDEVEAAVNAGDTFVLFIDAGSKKIKSLAAMIGYDNSAFEILTSEADTGYHTGKIVDNGTFFTFGGVTTTAKKVEAYVTIKVKETAATGEYDFTFLGCDEDFINGSNGAVTYGCDGITVAVNGASLPEEDKGYEDLAATVTVATGSTIDGQPTDWQVGTGFKAEFEVPAALDSMKWSAEIDGERMYSIPYDLTGFEGIEVGSPVVLYGAFTNGAWEGNAFGKTDVTKTVNEENAGIILKSGETFYASANAIAE